MERLAVIDFETSGLSPASGCRATEIAIVLLEDGAIVDRYQSLMNAGVVVPPFIEQLTGISNAMLRAAPPARHVMAEAAAFVGATPLVAHNASFDQKFWDAELARLGLARRQEFACSMRLARRLLPDVPNHKLGTLARQLALPATGRAHRALADAEMAAWLVAHLERMLRERHGIARVDHALLCRLGNVAKARMPDFLNRLAT
ncbi:3'-5' exonuclease [Paludibacterium yongneupense]|uniref:3'-5' exonuclease n=1 Tax=Paludibacterium yongneupense TaxID=400061 RepID=UPI00040B9239|nr:3'-5' exonuclease [Paludibacterium yongneupense]